MTIMNMVGGGGGKWNALYETLSFPISALTVERKLSLAVTVNSSFSLSRGDYSTPTSSGANLTGYRTVFKDGGTIVELEGMLNGISRNYGSTTKYATGTISVNDQTTMIDRLMADADVISLLNSLGVSEVRLTIAIYHYYLNYASGNWTTTPYRYESPLPSDPPKVVVNVSNTSGTWTADKTGLTQLSEPLYITSNVADSGWSKASDSAYMYAALLGVSMPV